MEFGICGVRKAAVLHSVSPLCHMWQGYLCYEAAVVNGCSAVMEMLLCCVGGSQRTLSARGLLRGGAGCVR